MAFLLSSQTGFKYLLKHNLFTQEEKDLIQIESKIAKNFNLVVSVRNGRQMLIKQEPPKSQWKTASAFVNEWRIQEFLESFPELSYIRFWLPEVLHFNADDSIIVFNYLNDYHDLADFYTKDNIFPIAIASTIGTILAIIHRVTLERQDYRDFFTQNDDQASSNQSLKLLPGLDRVPPEIFGWVPADGLKFFALYQRYDSLGQAIAELATAFDPCCLFHGDLKLNNILLHLDWEQALAKAEPSSPSIVRLIDWEFCGWGDPAFDLGSLIASYLQLWLSSLVVSNTIAIEESLRLAMTPLEVLQPSLAALIEAYLSQFPEILVRRPDFLRRVVQFAGLALIQNIQATIKYQKVFGNSGICMLQVAKSLLCRPTESISTVFGMSESDLTGHSCASV
jgi:hypothetical protein